MAVLAGILTLLAAHAAICAPLAGKETTDKESLAKWAALADADKDATINGLTEIGKSRASAANTPDIRACALEEAKSPVYAGYDFLTAYTACLFKLGLN
jgi:hypothetical protein